MFNRLFNRLVGGRLAPVFVGTLLASGGSGLATAQSLAFTIEGKVFGQGVSNGPDLDDLAAAFPIDTPVSLTLRIDRLGPALGQVTELTGSLAGQPITLFDVSTIPDLPPDFVPNAVDFVNDTSTVGGFTGDLIEFAALVEGATANLPGFTLPLEFINLDLLDTTGNLFAPGQTNLFTNSLDVNAFDTSPLLGFLQFNTPGGSFGDPRAFLSFSITEASPLGAVTGDYNDSGQVEQGDLDLVLQNWGVNTDTAGIPAGWINDLPQGQIEQTELDGVLQNWGSTSAPDFSGSSVPEPATSALLGLGFLARSRRRRQALPSDPSNPPPTKLPHLARPSRLTPPQTTSRAGSSD